jgi:hypothetical protein
MPKLKLVTAFVGACVLSFMAGRIQFGATPVQAQERAFTALDYQEITQLINRYAYGIDTCANNGYDYADVFTPVSSSTRTRTLDSRPVVASWQRDATRWRRWLAVDRVVARPSLCGPTGAI